MELDKRASPRASLRSRGFWEGPRDLSKTGQAEGLEMVLRRPLRETVGNQFPQAFLEFLLKALLAGRFELPTQLVNPNHGLAH